MLFHQKFVCGDSPVSRGIVMVQYPVAGTPLLRAMSAHSVAEALQDCFVEFLIYRLASRDLLLSSLHQGPGHMPQMHRCRINLLCYPISSSKRSHFCRRSAFSSVLPERPPGSERWNYYVGEKHRRQFCLERPLRGLFLFKSSSVLMCSVTNPNSQNLLIEKPMYTAGYRRPNSYMTSKYLPIARFCLGH